MSAARESLALPAGSPLGEYRLEKLHGAWGFYLSYEAIDRRTARAVAVHELAPEELVVRVAGGALVPRSEKAKENMAWARDRFLREGRALAACPHARIRKVSEVFESNDTAYWVMPPDEARTFKTWLAGLGHAPGEAELRGVLAGLLDGLEAAHAGGCHHLNLKPEVIQMAPDGPVLTHFAGARQAIARHSHGATAATTGYSAPEQYAVEKVEGAATDIYSLAAVLHRAITGQAPPDAEQRLVRDSYEPLAGRHAGIYRVEFLTAIDAALALDPGARPQTIRDWRRMLGITSGGGVVEFARRRPILVLAGVTALAVALWLVLRPDPEPAPPVADQTVSTEDTREREEKAKAETTEEQKKAEEERKAKEQQLAEQKEQELAAAEKEAVAKAEAEKQAAEQAERLAQEAAKAEAARQAAEEAARKAPSENAAQKVAAEKAAAQAAAEAARIKAEAEQAAQVAAQARRAAENAAREKARAEQEVANLLASMEEAKRKAAEAGRRQADEKPAGQPPANAQALEKAAAEMAAKVAAAEAERRAAAQDKMAAEKAAAERRAAEAARMAAAEKPAATEKAAEKAAADERAAAERAILEKRAAEAATMAAVEKAAAAEKAAAEKVAAEKIAAEKAAAEKVAAEKAAQANANPNQGKYKQSSAEGSESDSDSKGTTSVGSAGTGIPGVWETTATDAQGRPKRRLTIYDDGRYQITDSENWKDGGLILAKMGRIQMRSDATGAVVRSGYKLRSLSKIVTTGALGDEEWKRVSASPGKDPNAPKQ